MIALDPSGPIAPWERLLCDEPSARHALSMTIPVRGFGPSEVRVVSLVEEVIGHSMDGGQLATYLAHRFGPPNKPSATNPRMDRYRFSTDRSDLALEVWPQVSAAPSGMFTFYAPREVVSARHDWEQKHRAAGPGPYSRYADWRFWSDNDPLKTYMPAVTAALTELMAPIPGAGGEITMYGRRPMALH